MARLLGYRPFDGLARRDRTLDRIRRLSWREFELLLGEVYRQRRYLVAGHWLAGGESGVDLLLRRGGHRTLVHGRHWRCPVVDADQVRQLVDEVAARRADAGILVTCGHVTRAARALAGRRSIGLVDGRRLYAMVARTAGAVARAVLTSADWPDAD